MNTRLLWGWADLVALPAAISFQRCDEWGWTGFGIIIGPCFVGFEWRAA